MLWYGVYVRADVADDGRALEMTVSLLRDRYPQYGAGTRVIGPGMVVQVERWSGWSAEG
jgi:hypothetical protein